MGSGSTGDDTASEDTISNQGADGKHHSQVTHYLVIFGRSENGIRILLTNSFVTENLINRINYSQGTRNIAEDIIGMLERSGALNSPECHVLGAFLAELEKEVGHDAKHEISAFIMKYNLMR